MSDRLRWLRAAGLVVAVTGLFWLTGTMTSTMSPIEILETTVPVALLADYSPDRGAPLAPLSPNIAAEVRNDTAAGASPHPTPGPSPTPSGGPSPTPSPTLPIPTPTLPFPTPTLPIPTPTPSLPIPTPIPSLPIPTPTPSLPIVPPGV